MISETIGNNERHEKYYLCFQTVGERKYSPSVSVENKMVENKQN
jgi:hypothetical protein